MIKATKLGGLGRGLDALFEDVITAEEVDVESEQDINANGVVFFNINDVKPNPYQPRKHFDEKRLQELADSLLQHGMIQPIIVRSTDKGYVIVAGERRWRAAGIAGMERVPCLVRNYTDEEDFLIALIENMQREDLNAIEEACAFKEMSELYGMTQEQISKAVGRSRPYISNSMRLLSLPDKIQEMVKLGRLSGGHARALASMDNEDAQNAMAEKVCNEGLSVRELEKEVSDKEGRNKRHIKEKGQDIINKEQIISESLGVKVKLPSSRKKGKIEIVFSSEEQYDYIIEKLSK